MSKDPNHYPIPRDVFGKHLFIKCTGSYQPSRGTPQSAGIDLVNNLRQPHSMRAGSKLVIHTETYIQIPKGYVGLIFPRSGMGTRGFSIANTVGVIDADYRGEIIVHLQYNGEGEVEIRPGDRIAQMVIMPALCWPLYFVDELEETERGEGGFGSTGR